MGNCCCSLDDNPATNSVTTSLFDDLDEADDYCQHCNKPTNTLHNKVVSNKPLLICSNCKVVWI